METYPLDCIPAGAVDLVGGKALGLNALARAGLAIPAGFVAVGPFAPRDADLLWRRVCRRQLAPVAVRSSADREDGRELSFAGQFYTGLRLTGKKAFRRAFGRCLAPDKAPSGYAREFAAKPGRPAVIVQRMVAARKAGILFTVGPFADRHLAIEAVSGLGDALTAGKAAAVSYELDESGRLVRSGGDLLDDSELTRLRAMALTARKALGTELDIEWAIDQSGAVWLLQARPITAGKPHGIDELDSANDYGADAFTDFNIGEILPGALTPLTVSVVLASLDYGLRKTLVANGVYTSLPPGKGLACFSGHAFFDLTTIYGMGKRIMGASKEDVELTICGRSLPQVPDTTLAEASAVTKALNLGRYLGYVFASVFARPVLALLVARARRPAATVPAALYQAVVAKKALLFRASYWHHKTTSYAGAMAGTLYLMLREKGDGNPAAGLAALLAGIGHTETGRLARRTSRLAMLVSAQAPGRVFADPAALAAFLKTGRGRAQRYYRRFLARCGHRGIRETELAAGPWREDPRPFLASVWSQLGKTHRAGPDGKRAYRRQRRAFLARSRGIYGLAARMLIAKARRGVIRREASKGAYVHIVDCIRQDCERLGRTLAAAGLLPRPELIFFLKDAELPGLWGANRERSIKTAMARERVFARQQDLVFASVSLGVPKPLAKAAAAPAAKVLTGQVISRGYATGPARVLQKPGDAVRLKPGEIIVAPAADIGLAPFFALAGGLVTELGSSLSHAAVVARECSLPAVSGVAGAVKAIATGAILVLDAEKGVVTVAAAGDPAAKKAGPR